MKSCKICLDETSDRERYSGYHNTCVVKLFGSLDVSPLLDFDKRIFQAQLSQKYTKGMSMSGVQKKLSIFVEDNRLRPTASGGRFILKPTVDEFPELSANEHLSMKIGEVLRIPTPPCGLVQFSDGEPAYIVKRFDWLDTESKIQKEDMAQIFQIDRDPHGEYKYSQSYEDVGLKILEVTGNKVMQAYEFYRRVLHCFLIGNSDFHLKNISLSNIDRLGKFEGLTPNYDSVMTSLYFQEKELALDLLRNGEFSIEHETVGFLTRTDFELLGERIGLTSAAIQLAFVQFKRAMPLIFTLIEQSWLSRIRKSAYKETVERRAAKLSLIE